VVKAFEAAFAEGFVLTCPELSCKITQILVFEIVVYEIIYVIRLHKLLDFYAIKLILD
jgi:hypothetical protein